MKYAIISDIHGNKDALVRVLGEIKNHKVDRILCLGDLVGYFAYPNQVIDLLVEAKAEVIMGNHDLKFLRNESPSDVIGKYLKETISLQSKDFLHNLPPEILITDQGLTMLCVHGSPTSISEYMYPKGDNTQDIMYGLDADILLSGHTHVPIIEQFGDKFYINPGSVGKPKHGQLEATFALVELVDKALQAEIIYVAIDNTDMVDKMKSLGFPEDVIASATQGQ